MVATRRRRSTVDATRRRVLLARALVLANPKMPHQAIAEEIGMSRAMVAYYLSGRVKSFVERPVWAEALFKAAAKLGYGDEKGAAEAFRELAEILTLKK